MLNVEKLARILDTPWIFSNGALLMGIVIFVILLLLVAVFSKMDERAEGKIILTLSLGMMIILLHVIASAIYVGWFTGKTEEVLGKYEYHETSNLVTFVSGDDVRIFNKVRLNYNYIKLEEVNNGLSKKEELTVYDTELNEIERLTKK